MKEIKILNLIPIIKTDSLAPEDTEARIRMNQFLQEQTNGLVRLDSVFIDKGSSALESAYHVAVSVPYIMAKAKWAEKNGYDAVVLDCFMDPGLDECREILRIPVLGACQSACSLAMRLAGRFSVMMTTESCERGISDLLRKYHAAGNNVPAEALNIRVLDLYQNPQAVIERVVELGMECVRRGKVRALILGCTSMSDYTKPISEALAERGCDILVIDPWRAAVYDAVACVLMGVSQSKLAYQLVSGNEERLDFEILQ